MMDSNVDRLKEAVAKVDNLLDQFDDHTPVELLEAPLARPAPVRTARQHARRVADELRAARQQAEEAQLRVDYLADELETLQHQAATQDETLDRPAGGSVA